MIDRDKLACDMIVGMMQNTAFMRGEAPPAQIAGAVYHMVDAMIDASKVKPKPAEGEASTGVRHMQSVPVDAFQMLIEHVRASPGGHQCLQRYDAMRG